jgi:hypothetical protein
MKHIKLYEDFVNEASLTVKVQKELTDIVKSVSDKLTVRSIKKNFLGYPSLRFNGSKQDFELSISGDKIMMYIDNGDAVETLDKFDVNLKKSSEEIKKYIQDNLYKFV